MHLLKIIHGYPPHYNAGSEVYSQSVCNELSKSHQVSIFTREENPFVPDFTITEEEESTSRKKFIINMARAKDGYCHSELDEAFEKLLDKIKPDIAHIGHLNHLSTGIVARLKAKKIPIVFTLHDFWLMCPRGQFLQRNFGQGRLYHLCDGQENSKCASKCYQAYYGESGKSNLADQSYWEDWIARRMNETKIVAESASIFIAPSHYLRDRFINGFGIPSEKIIHLDYGFPMEYLGPVHQKVSGAFTFGYIGTHIPSKGIQHLIEAFSKIQGDCRLRIWGRHRGQDTEGLKKLVSAFKISDKVDWMGEYVNQNIGQAVFSKCDVIVVPSIWGENSPLVIHEAQACHIPVITANFGGMKEYVQHQVNGLLFEHRSPDSLAKQMQWALDNQTEMKALGNRGYLHSQNGCIPDIKSHCQQLQRIYLQTIQGYEK